MNCCVAATNKEEAMDGFLAGLVIAGVIAALMPHPNTTPEEINWAETVCQSNGGLDKLRSSGRFILPARAVCKNSATFRMPAGGE